MSLYTNSETLKKVMLSAWLVLCIFVYFDCMQGVASGLISGLGEIGTMKWTTTIDYWLIGIPLSCFLMFYQEMGIRGLWWGPSCAVAINYL